MRVLALVCLGLGCLLGSIAVAESVDRARIVCFSAPPAEEGAWYYLSSEVLGDLGIATESADDFVVAEDSSIELARWWGSYYAWYPEDPLVDSFNLRFYTESDCFPDELICEIIIPHDCHANQINDDIWNPLFEYYADATDGVCCNVLAGQKYWFSAQAGDHTLPPQWTRVTAGEILYCESAFRSDYFSFPDWVEAHVPIGESYDASQEFECGNCGAVAVESKSWGRLKNLYR